MEDLNNLTFDIIGCALKVHTALGPGLLESTYETCLAYEVIEAGFKIETQKALPVIYKEVKLDAGYRIDILVENKVIIELKAVEAICDIHVAQLLTYLKLSGVKIGLLINFNVKDLKQGIKRFAM